MNPLLHYEYGASKKAFVSTWRTSNTSTGSSASNQVKLPLRFTGSYNFKVNWGDGSADTITSWNQAQVTHTYAAAGDYTIKITGTFVGWQFNNTGDRLKILSISSWGKFRLGNDGNYFSGCTNLTLSTVTDILNLTGTTSFWSLFRGCSSLTTVAKMNEWDISNITNMNAALQGATSFNQNIGAWNTSAVLDMSNMFNNATAFNQNIGPWNVSSVTNMLNMFGGAASFNNGGNSGINSWNTGAVTTMNSMFNLATAFNQNIGSWNVSNVADFYAMFASATSFNNGGNSSINNWLLKTTGTVNMLGMFSGATYFNQPIDSWNTSAVTNMGSMFQSAIAFNQPLNNWNTSAVTNMSGMFQTASAFNQPLNNWNTSAVTNMSNMFGRIGAGTSFFNQNIGSWNVSNVNSFYGMFYRNGGSLSFNNGGSPDINNWSIKTTGPVNMEGMFIQCTTFNQPLNNWNTSAVTNMSGMFQGCMSFNQPLDNWNTSAVTNMSAMFTYASAFNQNIGSWNVSNVSNFSSMFTGIVIFNNGGTPDINNWSLKTTGSVNMANMFQYCEYFNQPLNNWNTSAVTNMSNMFGASPSNSGMNFNQPLNNWNTTAVTNMTGMFGKTNGAGNHNFNQNIGTWNVSNVTNFTNFMLGKTPTTFSSTNLDAIYNGWSSRTVKPSLSISFGTAKYTSASSAGRAILTGTPNNWAITDGEV